MISSTDPAASSRILWLRGLGQIEVFGGPARAAPANALVDDNNIPASTWRRLIF